ncbi:GTP cyclohydrolase [Cupriavidus sp. 2TAF22]|uniref:GTP cyclohydrolase n=1 Tax=unclassified Cupriavidus TaxID=2640874 RepID=UPI003F8EBF21
MSQNNAIYKGFKVSAIVRRASDGNPDNASALAGFLATVTITQVSRDSGSLRLVPPLEQQTARTPHDAIALAVTHARTVIDGMSTSVAHK